MVVTVSHSVQRRLQLRWSRNARCGSCTAAALGDWPTENPRGTVPALKEWAVTLQAMSEGRQHVRRDCPHLLPSRMRPMHSPHSLRGCAADVASPSTQRS